MSTATLLLAVERLATDYKRGLLTGDEFVMEWAELALQFMARPAVGGQ